ncbi:MAG TPA: DinB family protein [Candidatus Limnocylindria bacterium]|nr:DinB family protein [Candidatus Limnocylindria bacterium]
MAICPMCRAPHTRLGSTRPLAALRRAPARLARALRRVPRRLVARRPGRGEWAAAEVLSHLADAEIALAFRIRKIAAEPRGVLIAWDQDRWADHGGYRRTPPGEALATFAALRRSNLAYVGRLSSAQKRQHGRHPEYGRLTIPQMLAHWAEHDLNHLDQIRAAHRRLAGRRSRRS